MTRSDCIEQHQAVHLAGEPDAANVVTGRARLRQHAANGLLRRLPPVLGTLLGPQRPLHAHFFVRLR